MDFNYSKKDISIFHGVVNYGTQSGVFAKQLRKKGFDALSVTAYDKYQRGTDITLRDTKKNIIIKVYNHVANSILKVRCFFKFDVFHFYFGTTLTNKKWDLPFYKMVNKKVIFHYLGVDVQQYKISNDKYSITNVIFYIKNGTKHDTKIAKRLKRETKYADLQLVCAPYLSEFVPNSSVLPLAINLNEYVYTPKINNSDELLIMHAPTSHGNKGTIYILDAIDRLISEGYPIKKVLVENLSHEELKCKYVECDIFVDQLLAGWYGTASIEAMSIGRPTVCFIRKEYFKYIDYGEDIPIINANPETIYKVLKETCDNRNILFEVGKKSRNFVENIHDSEKLTDKLLKYYVNL